MSAKTKQAAPTRYVGKKELWMFSLGGLGQGMIYAMMSSYISDYYLNVLHLTPVFVLMLMLLARVWDAINDPLMGMIVDRHTTKWGKMKPYILFAAAPIAALTAAAWVKRWASVVCFARISFAFAKVNALKISASHFYKKTVRGVMRTNRFPFLMLPPPANRSFPPREPPLRLRFPA